MQRLHPRTCDSWIIAMVILSTRASKSAIWDAFSTHDWQSGTSEKAGCFDLCRFPILLPALLDLNRCNYAHAYKLQARHKTQQRKYTPEVLLPVLFHLVNLVYPSGRYRNHLNMTNPEHVTIFKSKNVGSPNSLISANYIPKCNPTNLSPPRCSWVPHTCKIKQRM